jgi:NADH:ubiquinone oxidoreductase subunit F (NADH-binding)
MTVQVSRDQEPGYHTAVRSAERTGAAELVPSDARLLLGVRLGGGRLTLQEHLGIHGPLPQGVEPERLVAATEAAGLLGRGGAGFPLGTKLRACRASARPGRRPLVVVNAAESEPASRKDFVLLTRAPHLVLDGAASAARAVGAREAVVFLHRDRSAGPATAVRAAIEERLAAGLEDPEFRLVDGPDRYLAGQASAVVAHLSGRDGHPTTTTAPEAVRGVGGRPTLLANAETLAHLALIARRGPRWFRGAGLPAEPGTMLVTVLGAVASAGVVEAPVGTSLGTLVAAVGGLAGAAASTAGALVGGYAGSWLAPGWAAAGYSRAGLRPLGADPGVGMLIVLPAAACPVLETARLAAWLRDERVGQCGPCLNGLPALAGAARALAAGGAEAAAAPEQLRRWSGMVEGRGACHHPDGVVRLVRSLLVAFGDDVVRHAGGAPCRDAVPAIVLPGRGDPSWR